MAAEVTITAAEFLQVDAAIIFADLLLPLEVMGLPFHFAPGEGPVIEKPVRTADDVRVLQTDRAAELGYVADAVALVDKALRSEAAGHRILRRALHAGQLHD
jgi:uroporphyrinogen decarboxylase